MEPRYSHSDYESKIYQIWEEHQAFNPDVVVVTPSSTQTPGKTNKSTKKPFTIIMPPPNANDPLHIGHAMFISLEDIMIRFHRMIGDDTLWLPGTDHAGIETQFVFEKKLAKQGKSRFDFDRETLYKMIWEYVQENSGVAVEQMKKIGASADWSRFSFMLDENIVNQVTETFVKLQNENLIYRDKRLVNYCTHCGTSYSELEVEYVDRTSPLYYLKYGPFTVATTRPETMFADTAVAVHPEDKRYKEYVGKTIEVETPIGKLSLKVVADEYVDPEFGTGVVKITPFHDFNDFDVWQRHKKELPEPTQVIGLNGKLTKVAGKYENTSVTKAREQVVADLKELNLLEQIKENYQNRVGTCYRCGRVIEPLPLPQFFVKVKPLTDRVTKAFSDGEFTVHGAGYDKILTHWLSSLKDWNISRQIVWGIRIPAWYEVTDATKFTVSFNNRDGVFTQGNLAEILKTGVALEEVKNGLQQVSVDQSVPYVISTTDPGADSPTSGNIFLPETDTFDTWFSSGQWPISTLKKNAHKDLQTQDDFSRFYPTSVMETAYDILMFWVMRMLMFGYFLTDKPPFTDIYLHGLVRDEKGQKMSKSKGNVVNPLEIITEFGADALRMALVIRSTPGIDKAVGKQDFKAMRNFTNKIWNAARFIEMSSDKMTDKPQEADQAFYAKLDEVTESITQQLGDLRIGLAAETVYNEFWHWFCDQAIEEAKLQKLSKTAILRGLETFLMLLHPFVPFVTEAVWKELKKDDSLLITTAWPQKIK